MNNNWIKYLQKSKTKNIDYTRLSSLKELKTNPVYNYVLNTLSILEKEKSLYNKKIIKYVEETLKYSEVSKCTNKEIVNSWKKKKLNLDVHNIASSEIYVLDNKDYDEVIRVLIKTHGLIGQYLRGEINFSLNKELYNLIEQKLIKKDELRDTLILLNKCIIGGVSFDIYDRIKEKVSICIENIINNKFDIDLSSKERLYFLNNSLSKDDSKVLDNILKNNDISSRIDSLFKSLEFWYYEASLYDFSIEEQIKILLIIYNSKKHNSKYLLFNKIMNSIYLDYNGKKEINIYKKRIVEKYLSDISFDEIISNIIKPNPHIEITVRRSKNSLIPYFKFSPQASKLIDFCEVAYTSDSIYNKAVLMLYDLFGFRRDEYDRFYNEINYLNRMNKSINQKAIILDYIVGKKILDVGPGGGALMDLILEKNNNLDVYGIDISKNVIDTLSKKKKEENKKWNLVMGDALNLEDYFKEESIDTIIYSSIIHELYSYIEYNGKKFNKETIIHALKSAYRVLKKGGRIIIRDGIKTEPEDEYRIIEFKNISDIEILNRYCNDFKGRTITYQKIDKTKVKMLVNDAMEFLYTYTWGENSYALEVQEQFGYFTPSEYVKVIEENLENSKIIICKAFLQEGYEENLLNKITIYDCDMNVVKLPNSTCLIVIEKN